MRSSFVGGQKTNAQHWVWQKWGGRNSNELFVILFSFSSGGRNTIWLLVVIFNFGNSIGLRFQADGILFPHLRQALPVSGYYENPFQLNLTTNNL
jgi:hypothetical protein